MSNGHPLSVVLQLSRCLRQVPGSPTSPILHLLMCCALIAAPRQSSSPPKIPETLLITLNILIVLASSDYVPLFRSILARSAIPRLLPSTLRTITRRVLWPLPSTLFLVARVLHGESSSLVATGLNAILGPPTLFNSRLYLVAA